MKKSFLIFIIIIFTLLIGLIIYSFSKSPTYYTGIATIVDYKGYKASYAKIDGVNDSKNDNMEAIEYMKMVKQIREFANNQMN